MNVVLYKSNRRKKINGTLFYSFEYYVFLKQFVPDLKYFILNASGSDIDYFKDIFKDKYIFDLLYLEDILSVSLTEFAQTPINNLLLLCTDSYRFIKDLSWNVKNIKVYSHNHHEFLDQKDNHLFYGYYDYQSFNKKTRLKFYKEIHKISKHRNNKVFVSALGGDMIQILNDIKIDPKTVYTKHNNNHVSNLFDNINKIVYYHTGNLDTNNRIIVESFIHEIPLKLYLNGYINDSIAERVTAIKTAGLDQFSLSAEDILIKDFLDECHSIL